MLRTILVAIGVSVMVLGGVLLAHGDDRDDKDDKGKNGNKKQHQAILNAVTSGNAQHGQLSSEITALDGGHQGILDAVNGGSTQHTTLQGEHAAQNMVHGTLQTDHGAQNAAHGTLQDDHGAQNTAHQDLSNKVDAVQAVVDALSSGGGGGEGNHTLRWDQALPAVQRFVILAAFGNAAVLDKETGLVWEQSPPITIGLASFEAGFQCTSRTVGGRKGWRLPSVHELASLVDPNSASSPFLPAGNPFTNIRSRYWSATTSAQTPGLAWFVDFFNGIASTDNKSTPGFAWCVRGGMNADQY